MDVESVKLIAAAIVMGVGSVGPSLGIGIIGGLAMQAMGRNPDAAPQIQTNMILGIVFTEAVAIYCLVLALIIKFV